MQDVQLAQRMIEEADINVYKFGITQPGDRRSLLSVQNIVRRTCPGYSYMEIGSDAGGSLYTHLIDEKCKSVSSIDLRPGSQPDERGVSFDYNGTNTTANMVEHLEKHLPLGSLLKLKTFDMDAGDLPNNAPSFDLGFIDGEHTNRAAFRDFLSLYRFSKPNSIILFHDSNLVTDAVANTESFLQYHKVIHEVMYLPDVVAAVLIGDYTQNAQILKRFAYDKEGFTETSKQALWNGIAQSRSA